MILTHCRLRSTAFVSENKCNAENNSCLHEGSKSADIGIRDGEVLVSWAVKREGSLIQRYPFYSLSFEPPYLSMPWHLAKITQQNVKLSFVHTNARTSETVSGHYCHALPIL